MRSTRLVMGLVLFLVAAVALAGCHYKLPPHPKTERPDSAWRTSKADRAGYTVHMVERALRLYKAKGREATVAYYNTPESVDGEWYVFIFDESDQLIAHANPDLIGMDLKEDLGLDTTGYRFGDLMLTATEEGLWVDYVFANLISGNQEYKHSYVVRHDGLLIGSGWYQALPDVSRSVPTKADRPGYAVHLVEQAIRRYDSEGRDTTIEYLNSPANLDGEWYVFLIDENDIIIGHPREELLGEYGRGDEIGELGVDITGYQYGELLHSANEDGLWVDYFFLNPATGDHEYKHTWVVRHDGLIFGSGWYQILPGLNLTPTKAHRAGFTVAMVEEALRHYDAHGRDATVAHYNTPESVDGEWYVFIFDENDKLIAHANPDLIGMDLKGDLGLDTTGYRFGDLMLTASEEGLWVDYLFANLVSGNQEYKHSYVVRRDGLLFGSGWYQILPGVGTGVSKADRPGFTVSMVEQAIQRYESEGREATVAHYSRPESVDGEWYVFIFDENEINIAHPNPEILGAALRGPAGVDITGYRHGDVIAGATEDGIWVDYIHLNLATGNQEYKHTWAVRHDGLIFASGWYEVFPKLGSGVTKAQPAEYTVAMVNRALRYYKAHGREEAVAYYNMPESVDGDWYVFIINEDDQVIANANQDLIGQDLKGELGIDATGHRYSDLLLSATEEGLWVDYVFNNPNTGEEQTKHSWVVRHDGVLIGSGWYE